MSIRQAMIIFVTNDMMEDVFVWQRKHHVDGKIRSRTIGNICGGMQNTSRGKTVMRLMMTQQMIVTRQHCALQQQQESPTEDLPVVCCLMKRDPHQKLIESALHL